jgi:hypothetical protein
MQAGSKKSTELMSVLILKFSLNRSGLIVNYSSENQCLVHECNCGLETHNAPNIHQFAMSLLKYTKLRECAKLYDFVNGEICSAKKNTNNNFDT